jgi:hypothetical protein
MPVFQPFGVWRVERGPALGVPGFEGVVDAVTAVSPMRYRRLAAAPYRVTLSW